MQSENTATLTEIRRHFHTLKGSGRMIGAKSSAELAWTVEDTLNRVINQTLKLTPAIQSYVQLVFKFYFLKLVDNFKQKSTCSRFSTAYFIRPTTTTTAKFRTCFRRAFTTFKYAYCRNNDWA